MNIYYTASIMKKRADAFFDKFGLTDVQFILLTLLYFQSPGAPGEGGLSQAQISDIENELGLADLAQFTAPILRK